MDVYSKIFLINMIVIGFLALVDVNLFDCEIVGSKPIGGFIQLWAWISLVSIPAWAIYIVVIF